MCVAGHQSADPEVIQNYVKKVRECVEGQNKQQMYRLGRLLRTGASFWELPQTFQLI